MSKHAVVAVGINSIFRLAEMLSDSVYNYATTRRGAADQDSDSQYETQAQLQITSSIQSKPRNKRKNFKPISSRMAEVSDESDRDDDEPEIVEESSSEVLEYERKTLLLPAEERSKQRLNNNEVSPMDLSVATRPPSSEADDDSADSLRHKFILEQLRSQKLYSPGTEVGFASKVCFSIVRFRGLKIYASPHDRLCRLAMFNRESSDLFLLRSGEKPQFRLVGEERERRLGRGIVPPRRSGHPIRG